MRVEMDIRGSLPKETTIVYNGEDVKIEFKYERLFLFLFLVWALGSCGGRLSGFSGEKMGIS